MFVFHLGKKIICCLMLFICCTMLYAFDFSLRLKPFVSIPWGEGNLDPAGNEMYSIGGGGDFGLELDISSILTNPIGLGYTLGAEGGLMINPFLNDSETNVIFYSIGGVFGLYYFPLSRLLVRADGAVGVYQATIGDITSEPGMFLRYGGELGFRFTPNFLIAGNAGWRQYHAADKDDLMKSGIYAGLTAQLTFNAGRSSGEGGGATLEQYGSVYPAFMQVYQVNPAGNVVIRNNENAEIRDVRLSFRADNYTSSEFPCGSVSIIPRGRSANIQLLADFSNEILRFTDTGRIMGELVIRYKFLGQERVSVRAVSVSAFNRNRVPQHDTMALASFISPTSTETLDFARFIAGLERSNRRTGFNQSLNYAIWLLEGLKASQVRIEPVSSSEDSQINVQFPAETLLFRSGTSRDMALLFAACLEGVGIGSAFIQTDNELLVAVSLGVNQSGAETLFNGTNRILIVNDNAWLPLSMSVLSEGFYACWNRGVSVLNNAFSSSEFVEFVAVQEAWAEYPPALMFELGRTSLRTDNAAALREVNRAIQTYITQEINPIIQRTSNMQNSAAQQNRLGILYVRAGRIAEGKAAYERAAGMGSVPAMTNRGNLALIERDFTVAERWFRQALQREPQNPTALSGLERVAEGR